MTTKIKTQNTLEEGWLQDVGGKLKELTVKILEKGYDAIAGKYKDLIDDFLEKPEVQKEMEQILSEINQTLDESILEGASMMESDADLDDIKGLATPMMGGALWIAIMSSPAFPKLVEMLNSHKSSIDPSDATADKFMLLIFAIAVVAVTRWIGENIFNKGLKESTMNITKGRLKQIIQEELSRETTSEGFLDNIKQKFKQPQVPSVPEFDIHWEAELAEAIGKALIKAVVEDDVLAVNDTLKSFAENAMRAGAGSDETKAAIKKVITNAAEHLQLAATDETSPLQNWDDLHKEAGPTEM